MKLAIIGSGISGLTAAYYLHRNHDITIYEANDYIGGHTHTHSIKKGDKTYNVDTGFIVFNKKTYPNFLKLIEELGVEYVETSMSFSVSHEQTGLEYNGTDFNRLFADRLNIFRPSFYLFLKGIINFNKKAANFLKNPSEITLKEFYKKNNIKNSVIENYLSPMIAAVWSTDPRDVWELPARFILQFFENHGFLEVDNRPQWYVIKGGSNSYVKKITQNFSNQIYLSTPVEKIYRNENGVIIKSKRGEMQYDGVILATHSNISLRLLADPSQNEQEILGAIPYTQNPTFLHQDPTFLPKRALAKASWNYLIPKSKSTGSTVTYSMNILQGFDDENMFNVTLNPHREINQSSILKALNYEHPLFNLKGMKAQQRWNEISGVNNTYYCGAYWRNGFHEDGVVSALRVVKQLEEECKVESIKESLHTGEQGL
ncbi:MAG: FAD-dependent oxidoreductase [Bacteriovoracaceae bacterium]